MVFKKEDYIEDFNEGWCPGCGNFGIREACYKTLVDLQLNPNKTVLVSGIGCSSKSIHDFKCYGAHTLHGRTLPVALGIKLANPELNVIIHTGDGDCYGIGTCHFVNTGRYNPDIKLIVSDNAVYALTKGQASPTLKKGEKPKALPLPNIKDAINPISIAIFSGYSFVAQGYAFDINKLSSLITQSIKHKGLAFINVKQPCLTYDNIHTNEFYQNAIVNVEDIVILTKDLEKPIKVGLVKTPFSNYKAGELIVIEKKEDEKNCYVFEYKKANEFAILPKNKAEELIKNGYARKITKEDWNDALIAFLAKISSFIPIVGTIYTNEENSTYEERIAETIKNYFVYPPAKQIICDKEGKPTTKIENLLDLFLV